MFRFVFAFLVLPQGEPFGIAVRFDYLSTTSQNKPSRCPGETVQYQIRDPPKTAEYLFVLIRYLLCFTSVYRRYSLAARCRLHQALLV